MQAKQFSSEGVAQFRAFILDCKVNGWRMVPQELLGGSHTRQYRSRINLELVTFDDSKLKAAEYLWTQFAQAGEEGIPHDVGLWSWITAYYWSEVCPAGSKPRELARYILDEDRRRYYRHSLFAPVLVYSQFRDDIESAAVLLKARLSRHTDFEAQILGRQGLLHSRGVIRAASHLYFDSGTGRAKRGANLTRRDAPGTLRRFSDLLNQLDRTYDLGSLDDNAVLTLLPAEFDQFRN